MVQLLIVIISIAIVAAGWYLIHLGKKLYKRLIEKRELKNAEKKAEYEAQVEAVKQRYLAEDKVVNLDEIEAEVRGKKFRLGDFIKGLIYKIGNFFKYSNVIRVPLKYIWICLYYVFAYI